MAEVRLNVYWTRLKFDVPVGACRLVVRYDGNDELNTHHAEGDVGDATVHGLGHRIFNGPPIETAAGTAVLMAVVFAVFLAARFDWENGGFLKRAGTLQIEAIRASEPIRLGNRAISEALPELVYAGTTQPNVSRGPVRIARHSDMPSGVPLIRDARTVIPADRDYWRLVPHLKSPMIRVGEVEFAFAASPLRVTPLKPNERPRVSDVKLSAGAPTLSVRPPSTRQLRYSSASNITRFKPVHFHGVVSLKPSQPNIAAARIRIARVLAAPHVAAFGETLEPIALSRPEFQLSDAASISPAPDHSMISQGSLRTISIAPTVALIGLTLHQAPERMRLSASPPMTSKLSNLAIQSLPYGSQQRLFARPPRAGSNLLRMLPSWRNAMFSPTKPRVTGQEAYQRGRCIAPSQFEKIGQPRPAQPRQTHLKGDAFGLALAIAADRQRQWITIYSAKYQSLPYPLGDLPIMMGSCSDVIIRAYRDLGYDLQAAIQLARVGSGDRNIDHRRTNTLRRLFMRNGQSFVPSPYPEDYKPGDIVTYYRPFSRVSRAHIAIVSHLIAPSGRPYIIHNRGYNVQLEDALFVDRMTGHYRFRPFDSRPTAPIKDSVPMASKKPMPRSTSRTTLSSARARNRAKANRSSRLRPPYALGATR